MSAIETNTLFIGKDFRHFAELPSTNQFAIELLSKSKPSEGTAISTFCQVAGRGQIGSKWESEPHHNLTISFILYPSFLKINNQFNLNIAVSLAIHDFITHYVPSKKIFIKWSNDIYIEDKKVCGVLIQNTLSGHKFQNAIIGIGININQTQFQFAPNATSLQLETGKSFNLFDCIATLCKTLEVRYLQLKAGKIDQLKNEYLQHLYRNRVQTFFKRIKGEQSNEVFEGMIIGISPIGKLRIQRIDGVVEEFGVKEVAFLN